MNSVVSSKPNALKHFMLYSAVSAISSMLPFPFKKAWKSARSILILKPNFVCLLQKDAIKL